VTRSKGAHLAARFFGALSSATPRLEDVAWVETILTADEFEMWQHQPNHDRRHAIAVGRGVQSELAGTAFADDPRWLACALLHDIGKLDARLGVYGRVVATMSGAVGGRSMADAWSERRGFTRRVGLYLRHPELGGVRIRVAGGAPEVARWAEVHHEKASERPVDLGIPDAVVAALDTCDND